MEVNEWVLQKIGEVSEVMGVSFDGLEKKAWGLFAKFERREMGARINKAGLGKN